MVEDLTLPDNGFQTRGSRQLLWDVWYVLRSKSGLGALLDAIAERSGARQIPVYDQYGKVSGSTSKDNEASWNRTNFARLSGQITGLLEAVKQLSKAQGGTIDMEAVKQASKDGAAEAIAEGVKVDVTVNGVASNG